MKNRNLSILLVAIVGLPAVVLGRWGQGVLTSADLKKMEYVVRVEKTDVSVNFVIQMPDGTTNFPPSTTVHLRVCDSNGNFVAATTLGMQLIDYKNCLSFSVAPTNLKHSRFLMRYDSTPPGRGIEMWCTLLDLFDIGTNPQQTSTTDPQTGHMVLATTNSDTTANLSPQEEQQLFDKYKQEAWEWTAKRKEIGLTKSHGLPSLSEKSIVYADGKPHKILYGFYPMGRRHSLGNEPGDILVEYDLDTKSYEIILPKQ